MSYSPTHIATRVSIPSGFRRTLIASTITLACAASLAQTDLTTSAPSSDSYSNQSAKPLDRQELFRQIGINEKAARDAYVEHGSVDKLASIYVKLGLLYGNVALHSDAERSTRRAIELLKDGPQSQLAEEINRLSLLHTSMGKASSAEKEHMQALAICESIADPECMTLTWAHLGTLYFKERKMKKSLEYAGKAYSALAQLPGLKASDRIAILQTKAFALCGNHRCGEAIPVMKDAVAQAQSAYGEDSLSASLDYFMLGYIYWHSKDTTDAAKWMERGIDRMRKDLGWGQPLYVNSMEQYAHFLRETGQRDAATEAESEVRRIQSVVDARTLTTWSGGPLASAMR